MFDVSFDIYRGWKKINSPEDDQSLLIDNVELYPQFFLELITTQLRFYMVSPQLSLLKNQYRPSLGSHSFEINISFFMFY